MEAEEKKKLRLKHFADSWPLEQLLKFKAMSETTSEVTGDTSTLDLITQAIALKQTQQTPAKPFKSAN